MLKHYYDSQVEASFLIPSYPLNRTHQNFTILGHKNLDDCQIIDNNEHNKNLKKLEPQEIYQRKIRYITDFFLYLFKNLDTKFVTSIVEKVIEFNSLLAPSSYLTEHILKNAYAIGMEAIPILDFLL